MNESTLCDVTKKNDSGSISKKPQGVKGDGLVIQIVSELATKVDNWDCVARALVLPHWVSKDSVPDTERRAKMRWRLFWRLLALKRKRTVQTWVLL